MFSLLPKIVVSQHTIEIHAEKLTQAEICNRPWSNLQTPAVQQLTMKFAESYLRQVLDTASSNHVLYICLIMCCTSVCGSCTADVFYSRVGRCMQLPVAS